MDAFLLRDCAARIAANSAFLAAPDAVLARLWNLCPVVQKEVRKAAKQRWKDLLSSGCEQRACS